MRAAYVFQSGPDPFQTVSDVLNSPYVRVGFWVVASFFVLLWLALTYWTFVDADRRGALRFLWGGVALVFPFVGALIYLIVRPPEYLLDSRERELDLAVLERELKHRVDLCPNCRSIVEKEYLLCPECDWDLKKRCEGCQKPLELSWGTCPYCATIQSNKNVNR
ncbi:MAG TPA: zinc ribbon domain-containing protein [Rubrobacteraceae bacterium]|nr:zinc ribbon domain-containing protein [Rubrobacteraceae bacterium]